MIKLKSPIFVNIIISIIVLFLETIPPISSMDRNWSPYNRDYQNHLKRTQNCPPSYFNEPNVAFVQSTSYCRTNFYLPSYNSQTDHENIYRFNEEVVKYNEYVRRCNEEVVRYNEYVRRYNEMIMRNNKETIRDADFLHQFPYNDSPQNRATSDHKRFHEGRPQTSHPYQRPNAHLSGYNYGVNYSGGLGHTTRSQNSREFEPNWGIPNTTSLLHTYRSPQPNPRNSCSYDVIVPLNTQGGNNFYKDSYCVLTESCQSYSSEDETSDSDTIKSYSLDKEAIINPIFYLEQVEEYIIDLAIKGTCLSSIILISDLDGTLTQEANPKKGVKLNNSNATERGSSVRIVKDAIEKGVNVVVSSAWDNFSDTLEKIKILNLDKALGVNGSHHPKFNHTFENEFGKKECECYCAGRVASVRDLNYTHPYYGNKELSFRIVHPMIDPKEVRHLIFVDDKKININNFSINIKDKIIGLRDDTEVTLFLLKVDPDS